MEKSNSINEIKRECLRRSIRAVILHAYTMGRLDYVAGQKTSLDELEAMMHLEVIGELCFPESDNKYQ